MELGLWNVSITQYGVGGTTADGSTLVWRDTQVSSMLMVTLDPSGGYEYNTLYSVYCMFDLLDFDGRVVSL